MVLMGARAKVIALVLLIIIVALAVWQFTSPSMLPVVGTRYSANAEYANRGSWTVKENMSYARAFLAFSIANLTYPKPPFPPSTLSSSAISTRHSQAHSSKASA